MSGFCTDPAADWLEGKQAIDRWDANAGANDLVYELKAQCASPTRRNQWVGELQTIHQEPNEKVGVYVARFNKLMRKVAPDAGDLAVKFRVGYFIRGLNSMIAGRVFKSNPATLEEVVTRAKNVEMGNNLAMENFMKYGTGMTQVDGPQENKPPVNIFNKEANDKEMDDLIKQMGEWKLNKLEMQIKKLENKARNKRAKCFKCGQIGLTYIEIL